MQEKMSVREAAEYWNVPVNQVTRYCREDRVYGAKKENGVWVIPAYTEKPSDRRKEKAQSKRDADISRKPLPVGVSSYREMCEFYYYVDKTLLIKDFLDERSKVSLFTRPRRFGKTLAMDMLRTFFEKTHEDTSVYFKDKMIWACGEKYRDYQGKYPVIFVTFKDIKFNTWNETFAALKSVFSNEAQRHHELLTSEKCDEVDKSLYEKMRMGNVDEVELSGVLRDLSRMLHKHHGIAPIIIIDEYDIPIQQGHMKDYYEKIILFMRNLFSGGLKDNSHLSFGVLTGILSVAKESIFSGLNNLTINSVLDSKYSSYFGFTTDEIRKMTEYYGVTEKYEEICQWYDGYHFGKTEIFNPWSVINYFNNECEPRAFWLSTGSNDIIGEIIAEADEDFLDNLYELLQGKSITTYVDTNVIYPEIKSSPSSVYSFLLVSGYLRLSERGLTDSGDFMCRVSLPNKEITLAYKKEIIERMQRVTAQSTSIGIQEALYTGNTEKLQKQLQKYLMESVSVYDTQNENSYHMLLLGLCAVMSDKYFITSNRESGEGRFDIQLEPKILSLPGFLIELKAQKNCSGEKLKELAQTALQQIQKRKYESWMRGKGINRIYSYGIAFSNKCVEIAESNCDF